MLHLKNYACFDPSTVIPQVIHPTSLPFHGRHTGINLDGKLSGLNMTSGDYSLYDLTQ